jgi:hypothetical protein
MKERRNERKEKKAEKSRNHSRKGGKFKALLRDIQLNAEQKEIIKETNEFKGKHLEERRNHGERLEMIEAYLNGERRKKDIKSQINNKFKDGREDAHERTELWLELFDSFDDSQKEQFLSNVQNMKSNKRNKRQR